MPTITDVRQEITKALESTTVPKSLYVVAGVGDLAIEKLRDLHLEQRIAGLGDGARALPGKVQHVQEDVQGKVRELPTTVKELPGTVLDAALAASGRATGLYEDLSVRGKKIVDGLSTEQTVTITDAAPPKKPAAEKANGTTKSQAKSTAAKKSAAKKTAAKKTAKPAAKKS